MFHILMICCILLIFIWVTFLFPYQSEALEKSSGEELFKNNCLGCHVNGGNIIRRGKTLKLESLKRNGLDDPKAIAKVAQEGVGVMSGYKEVLGEGGDLRVANWIWEQSQKAWVQE